MSTDFEAGKMVLRLQRLRNITARSYFVQCFYNNYNHFIKKNKFSFFHATLPLIEKSFEVREIERSSFIATFKRKTAPPIMPGTGRRAWKAIEKIDQVASLWY